MIAFFQNVVLWQNVLMWGSLSAAVVLSAAGAFAWCDAREALPGRRILRAFVRLPWLVRLFLAAFVVQLVVHGSTKTNQTDVVSGGTTNQTDGADYPLPSTNYPLLSAQIELHSDGDFVTRSNEVEIAYRRVDPNDWDGDGWHNDDDPSPKVWTDGTFGLEQSLPTNANADAYCWVDVRASYNSVVRFVGDGPSNLPDPVFTARAGVTYRVMLLIGKGYEVTSDRPLSVVSRSSTKSSDFCDRSNGSRQG